MGVMIHGTRDHRRPDFSVMLLLFLAFVFVRNLLGVDAGTAKQTYQPKRQICPTDSNFSAGEPYQANVDILVHRLSTVAADGEGFLNETYYGADPSDTVYGIIMCVIETTWESCLECLRRAPSYVSTACPNGRTGGLLYRDCLLRYSDQPFFGDETDRGTFTGMYVEDYFGGDDVVQARWEMMRRLMGQAASSSSRYAYGNQTYNSGWSLVYGLVHCRRDLTNADCSSCLSDLVQKLLGTYPNNTTAYLQSFSCYARYHTDPINILAPPGHGYISATLQPPHNKKKDRTRLLIRGMEVIAATSTLLLLLTISVLLCLLYRRWWQKRMNKDDLEAEFINGAGPKRFSYSMLATATGNFADDQKLGEGGFGSVYRGFLAKLSLDVAIKRVSRSSKQGRKEYVSEVTIISRLRHRNLVKLVGWCHSPSHEELLLVYDLMPNGSLDAHLYNQEKILPWSLRYDIVIGIGSALLYLHQDCEQGVLHRDVKPSNIMLDASFNAKLGDFGLARLVEHGRAAAPTTELAGTMGYIDPECTTTGRFTTESDMYSFGVVLLEVACGRLPVLVRQDNTAIHLAQRVSELHRHGAIMDAADPRLNGDFSARQMECVLVVGLWCTQLDRSQRPSIRQALSALRFEESLPALSNRLPVRMLSSIPSLVLDDEDYV